MIQNTCFGYYFSSFRDYEYKPVVEEFLKNNWEIRPILSMIDDNGLVQVVEGLPIDDAFSIIRQLDANKFNLIKNRLEIITKNRIASKYNIPELFDPKGASLLDFGQVKMISKFKSILANYVDPQRIEQLETTYRFCSPDSFKLESKSPRAMAFNNGYQSVMNLEYDETVLRSNLSHESIHHLSANDIQTPQGFTFKRGFSINSQNRGINECATEFINEIVMGEDYYTRITGQLYCGYQPGVEQLKRLFSAGILDQDSFMRAYFSNDLSYVEKQIVDITGNQQGFQDFLGYLDQFLEDDYDVSQEGLRKATDFITDVINRKMVMP